ncbi:MAG: hypothetical protein H5T61_07805 [Thermoflexales bacterium]|nr:hypothetical protein [Thermoflexales bacterium]
MPRTVRGVLDKEGNVHLLEPVQVPALRPVLVIVLDDEPLWQVSETALLSELALAEDWNRPEEDEAWSHLQRVPWS